MVTEVRNYGLRLCQSDLNRNNFMKDSSGRIVALDFGDCCFLPLSFMEFALRRGGDSFTHLIAPLVQLPELTQFNALLTASLALVPFGTNNIGEDISLLFSFPCLSFHCKEINFNVPHRPPTQSQIQVT